MSYREYRRQRHRWRVLRYQSIFTEYRRLDTHLRRHGRSASNADVISCQSTLLWSILTPAVDTVHENYKRLLFIDLKFYLRRLWRGIRQSRLSHQPGNVNS